MIGNHHRAALPLHLVRPDLHLSVNLSSNGNAQFMTTDAAFTNECLPWTSHDYTIFPYWDDLYLVNSGFGHIHIDKWHCSQPHLQHRVAGTVISRGRHCQLRAEVV